MLVGGEHARIKRDAVECREATLADAFGGRFFLEVGEECVEAARRIASGSQRRRSAPPVTRRAASTPS